MTDNEIIKALGCCVYRSCNECIRQPIEYGRTERDCKTGLMKCALDLINDQKAEIESLQNKVEELSEVLSDTIRIRYAECRADAIKEFAERFKDAFPCVAGMYRVHTELFDNLVKEMVGDGQ